MSDLPLILVREVPPLLQVGQQVPDFTLTTYEPKTKGFGKYSLAEAKKNGKWTLLFFYPADFTFV
jgi:peroxiredoxin (alkyl hydroperoxide reductase subunit C)